MIRGTYKGTMQGFEVEICEDYGCGNGLPIARHKYLKIRLMPLKSYQGVRTHRVDCEDIYAQTIPGGIEILWVSHGPSWRIEDMASDPWAPSDPWFIAGFTSSFFKRERPLSPAYETPRARAGDGRAAYTYRMIALVYMAIDAVYNEAHLVATEDL